MQQTKLKKSEVVDDNIYNLNQAHKDGVICAVLSSYGPTVNIHVDFHFHHWVAEMHRL